MRNQFRMHHFRKTDGKDASEFRKHKTHSMLKGKGNTSSRSSILSQQPRNKLTSTDRFSDKLVVVGYSHSTTKEDLRKHFKSFGKICSITLRTSTYMDIYQFCGKITFADRKAVERATKSAPHIINKEKLNVKVQKGAVAPTTAELNKVRKEAVVKTNAKDQGKMQEGDEAWQDEFEQITSDEETGNDDALEAAEQISSDEVANSDDALQETEQISSDEEIESDDVLEATEQISSDEEAKSSDVLEAISSDEEIGDNDDLETISSDDDLEQEALLSGFTVLDDLDRSERSTHREPFWVPRREATRSFQRNSITVTFEKKVRDHIARDCRRPDIIAHHFKHGNDESSSWSVAYILCDKQLASRIAANFQRTYERSVRVSEGVPEHIVPMLLKSLDSMAMSWRYMNTRCLVQGISPTVSHAELMKYFKSFARQCKFIFYPTFALIIYSKASVTKKVVEMEEHHVGDCILTARKLPAALSRYSFFFWRFGLEDRREIAALIKTGDGKVLAYKPGYRIVRDVVHGVPVNMHEESDLKGTKYLIIYPDNDPPPTITQTKVTKFLPVSWLKKCAETKSLVDPLLYLT